MKIRIRELIVATRRTREVVEFSPTATFIYGPVGTGKSTVARIVDYCLGGNMERTPAVQREFVAATLSIELGPYTCKLERAATDTRAVRVSWSSENGDYGSVNAPLRAGDLPVVDEGVYNLSDLLFFLAGVTPIKVRKRRKDPESPMVRLSFRDVWWYCYLDQAHMDSSFFQLEHPFKRLKSQDVMRFFTGFHSERLSELETTLFRTIDERRGKREAVERIREFMGRFGLESGVDVTKRIERDDRELEKAQARRSRIEDQRQVQLHPTDGMRDRLRELGEENEDLRGAIGATEEAIAEQGALRAELITAKVKAERKERGEGLLGGVAFQRCPKCGSGLSTRSVDSECCSLCLDPLDSSSTLSIMHREAVRRDLNERIDEIADSIKRRKMALGRSKRELDLRRVEKRRLDETLQHDLARYDSGLIERIRELDRKIATLIERRRFWEKLQEMREAIGALESEAGALQGKIESLQSEIRSERLRLREADKKVATIAGYFKAVMLKVGFPGVEEDDEVVVNLRNWRPTVQHNGQEWSFWEAGSGGKKTLFNVCYALAVHAAGIEHGMPVPDVLIIDSPTKNISDDEDPELVRALYRAIYELVESGKGDGIQFLLIDSDLVPPEEDIPHFVQRHMAGRPDAPSLIPYYTGP